MTTKKFTFKSNVDGSVLVGLGATAEVALKDAVKDSFFRDFVHLGRRGDMNCHYVVSVE